MSSQPQLNIDRYVVIHVATTCDEHGVYVTKDSAEVIELGWILLDANSLEEVSGPCRAYSYSRSLSPFPSDTLAFNPIDHPRERSRQASQYSDYSALQ